MWRRWTREFLDALHQARLPEEVIWKINCRADVVEPELFAEMRDAGLYLVYMGLESGSEQGLETLNKEVSVEQNIQAVKVLREVSLMHEFGFMLFDPSSTFQSIRDNAQFLRTICDDGRVAAVFCRMLPYDGTPIKDELARTGRLRGDVYNPDYDFLDPRLDGYYYELKDIVDVTGWIHGYKSLSPQLNHAWHEVAIIERLFPSLGDLPIYTERLSQITKASNEMLLTLVEDLADVHELGRPNRTNHASNPSSRDQCGQRFLAELVEERNAFIAANQDILMQALEREVSLAAVSA